MERAKINDRLSEEKDSVCQAFDVRIKTLTDSVALRMKSHPRAIGNMVQLHRQIMDLVINYIQNGKIPEVHIQTREEIQDSVARKNLLHREPKKERIRDNYCEIDEADNIRFKTQSDDDNRKESPEEKESSPHQFTFDEDRDLSDNQDVKSAENGEKTE